MKVSHVYKHDRPQDARTAQGAAIQHEQEEDDHPELMAKIHGMEGEVGEEALCCGVLH